MKINKKVLISLGSITTLTFISFVALTSCSQGANPNLNYYNLKVGSNEYKIQESADYSQVRIQQKQDNGSWKELNAFNPTNASDNDKNDENIQKNWALASINYQVSKYLYNTMTDYLSWWTRLPEKETSGLTHEFKVAYAFGLGEGKNTYRLKINSINFDIVDESKVWNTSWKYGNHVDNDNGTAKVADSTVQIQNITLNFSYWKPNGGSNITEITDINVLRNTNWSQYWSKYNAEPTKTNFTVSISSKLTFNISQIAIENAKDKWGVDEANKYISAGTVKMKDLTSNIYEWPLVFGDTVDEVAIKNQQTYNKKVIDDLKKSYDDVNWKKDSDIEKYINDKLNFQVS